MSKKTAILKALKDRSKNMAAMYDLEPASRDQETRRREEMSEVQILQGDSLAVMKTMPDCCVQMCVTSPPYWKLRDYHMPGQLGLERTPDEYADKMVEIFREVRRILADDGTLWLNLGDCYNGSGGAAGLLDGRMTKGLKYKDQVGIPWLVAFALRADGWYLRKDIVWDKPNVKPESIKDRPTSSHEFVFLMSKSERYYYDSERYYYDYEAILEPALYDGRKDTHFDGTVKDYSGSLPDGKSNTYAARGHERWPNRMPVRGLKTKGDPYEHPEYHGSDIEGHTKDGVPARNKRDVWRIPAVGYKGTHFATYPPALVEPCILAGSKPGDIVLDPFAGSGTTGQVALEHGRNAVLIELNPEYVTMIQARLSGVQIKMTL